MGDVLRFGPEVKNLLRKLLLGFNLYFSEDVLNSDGRKLFHEVAKMLIYEHPEYKALISRVRRNLLLKIL